MNKFCLGMAQLALALAALTIATTVASQTPVNESTETRLRRLEGELRAVQRKVFPEGASRAFGAEINPPSDVTTLARVPAATVVSDLLTRMDTVEAQLQRLTAASEETQNQLAKLDGRLKALEPTSTHGAVPTASAVAPKLTTNETAATKSAAQLSAVTGAAKPEPSPDRLAAVRAIEKPVSDDKGEDEYGYGYRLWEAKFLPEAQQQLSRLIQQFPKHKRVSYARNLLGRAYLDDGKPGTAAPYFVKNYQANPRGDRAADSLLYLSVAMTRLKETKRACVALGEFKQVYLLEAIGRLKSQFDAASKAVTCN